MSQVTFEDNDDWGYPSFYRAYKLGLISNEVATEETIKWMDQHLFWNIYCRGSDSSEGVTLTLRRQRRERES